MSLGEHFLVDYYECDAKLINDLEYVRQSMLEAAKRSKATIINDNFHQFSPQGISGVIVIAESHISIHTWPELGYASVDVYTCSDKMDPQAAIDYLKQSFKAERVHQQQVTRGSRYIKNQK